MNKSEKILSLLINDIIYIFRRKERTVPTLKNDVVYGWPLMQVHLQHLQSSNKRQRRVAISRVVIFMVDN